jgi:hypothetical protein
MTIATAFAAFAILVAAPISAAEAQSWQRRVIDGTASVSGQTERGGSWSRSTTCASGRRGCSTGFSATGAGGRAIEGTRESVRGPVRGRSVTTITGPEGNTFVRPDRWRR